MSWLTAFVIVVVNAIILIGVAFIMERISKIQNDHYTFLCKIEDHKIKLASIHMNNHSLEGIERRFKLIDSKMEELDNLKEKVGTLNIKSGFKL